MRPTKRMNMRLCALLAMLLAAALIAGCTASPDATEDPLGKYNSGVNSLLPFATVDPSLNTPTPAPTATPWAPEYTEAPAVTAAPTPASGYGDLSYGASGETVSQLQGRLKALGYFNGALDGKYGDSTSSAVRLFQTQLGVSKTGLASASLQSMLFSSSAPRYNTGMSDTSDPYEDTSDPYEDIGGVNDFDPDYPDEDYSTPAATKKPAAATTKPTAPPTSSGYQTLTKGDKGAEVSSLQRSLKSLGYYSGSVDSDYGSGTVAAVKRFQKTYGQKQTGVATAAMQKKLFSGDAVRYTPPTPPKPEASDDSATTYVQLQRGVTGEKVKALQRRLKALGYFDGEIGGNYLDLTIAAVKRFQKALGLNQTGVATVSLQKRLFADDAPSAAKPKPTKKPNPTPTPKPSTYSELKEGASGKAVERLQQRLKDLGYYDGKVTGGFGKNTTASVKLFQKNVDLRQTGVATSSLQKLLFSDEAPDRKTTTKPAEQPKYTKLKKGSTGAKVKALQRRLKELGFFDGEIGGNYLTKTETAVKAFQKSIGVKQDGIATTDLQEKLFSEDAPSKGKDTALKALKYKDKGDAVYNLQLRLIELGFMNDFGKDGEGTYGAVTRDAVIDVQMARGFDSDGNADLEFMRFIMSDKAFNISPYDFES